MEKLKYVLLLCVMLLASTVFAQETDTTQQAAQAYESGDYVRAITLYDQALLAQQNGSLYYNLGAANYAAGNLGEALWSFQMAALYLPRDADVRAAIEQVREERSDDIGAETNLLFQFHHSLSGITTRYELTIVGFALWISGFIILIVGVFRKSVRRITQIVAGGIGVLVLVTLFALGTMSFVQTQRPVGVIVGETVQVMNGPGEDFLPLFTLGDAAEFRVVERNGQWLRFVLPDGWQGWLNDTNIKLIPNNLG